MKEPPERKEELCFYEDEEISWRQFLLDFKSTVWPMLQAEGFTYKEALFFWRMEMISGRLCKNNELLEKLLEAHEL